MTQKANIHFMHLLGIIQFLCICIGICEYEAVLSGIQQNHSAGDDDQF